MKFSQTYRQRIAVLVLGLASACTLLTGPELPTPLPGVYIPTAIAQTVTASGLDLSTPEPASGEAGGDPQDPVPTDPPLASPAPASATPLGAGGTAVNAASPTPLPLNIPLAAIQILSPGPASKVKSPFLLRASVPPGPNGVVRTELLGEDGRLLMRDVRVYGVARGAQVAFGLEVNFEISAVAEAGRVQISIEDENGQVMALAAVDVVLLSIGDSDLNPAGDLLENLVIESPGPNALIQGGMLRVAGLARPRTDQPLMVELKAADGTIVGTRQVAVVAPASGGHGIFAIDVPYTVSSPIRVRLIVWERGDPVPGIAHLSSLEVMLSP
jgi:hypothetical protein